MYCHRGFEFEADSDDAEIIHPRFYNFGDGRIIFDEPEVASELDSVPVKSQDPYIARFQYYLKDHLGNTMVIYEDKDKDLLIKPEDQEHAYDVVERFMYYPFGMKWEDVWPLDFNPEIDEENRYLYNGKELHRGSGLYDYGFRYYMAEIGRFTGVDPLAEKMPAWSPYTYGFNAPIRFIDPDGRMAFPPADFEGTAWIDGDGIFNRDHNNSGYQWTSHDGTDMGYVASEVTISGSKPGPIGYAYNRLKESVSTIGHGVASIGHGIASFYSSIAQKIQGNNTNYPGPQGTNGSDIEMYSKTDLLSNGGVSHPEGINGTNHILVDDGFAAPNMNTFQAIDGINRTSLPIKKDTIIKDTTIGISGKRYENFEVVHNPDQYNQTRTTGNRPID